MVIGNNVPEVGYNKEKHKGVADMAAININHEKFQQLLREEKPLLVDYWAPWCSYCRRIAPAYEIVARDWEDKLTVAKINIDEEPALAQAQRIEVIPTLVLYRGGDAIDSIVAPESKAMIDEFIRKALG